MITMISTNVLALHWVYKYHNGEPVLDRMTKCGKNRLSSSFVELIQWHLIQWRGHDWEQEPFLRSNFQIYILKIKKPRKSFSFQKLRQSIHVL